MDCVIQFDISLWLFRRLSFHHSDVPARGTSLLEIVDQRMPPIVLDADYICDRLLFLFFFHVILSSLAQNFIYLTNLTL